MIALSIRRAHQQSLSANQPAEKCSICRDQPSTGTLLDEVIDSAQQPENWYVLAAYPHMNPLEAVVLYADEKAAILNNCGLEEGAAPPEQDEDEGDVAYLGRLVDWIANNMGTTAGDILTELARDQLLQDFDPVSELDDALQSLRDLSAGIVRPEPCDDE